IAERLPDQLARDSYFGQQQPVGGSADGPDATTTEGGRRGDATGSTGSAHVELPSVLVNRQHRSQPPRFPMATAERDITRINSVRTSAPDRPSPTRGPPFR